MILGSMEFTSTFSYHKKKKKSLPILFNQCLFYKRDVTVDGCLLQFFAHAQQNARKEL